MKKLPIFLLMWTLLIASTAIGANITTTFVPQTPDASNKVDLLVVSVAHDYSSPETIKIDFKLPDGSVYTGSLQINPSQTRKYYVELDPAVPANTVFEIKVYYIDGSTETRFLNQPQNPLPVQLVSFDVYKRSNTNVLTWVTASEKNSDRYIIERSTDGKFYETIGTVNAAGNSSNMNKYTFTDNTGDQYYYRLKNIDLDGKFDYSKIVFIKELSTYTLQVNNRSISQDIAANEMVTQIVIVDTQGRQIYSGNGNSPINLTNRGIAVVTIFTNQTVYRTKTLL